MSLKEDIEQAIDVHGAWKAKFRNFLSGKAAFDLSAIGDTHACELGRWLAQEGRWLLPQRDHDEICRLHAEFHHVVGEVIQKIRHKDFGGARHDVGREGGFEQASHALTAALRKATLHSSPKPAQPEAPTASVEPAASSSSTT
jgi:hypothetical protein